MRSRRIVNSIGAVAALVVFLLAGTWLTSPRVRADDDDEGSKIQQGFAIAPVPLNLAGKDRSLVGFGSYLVNAIADCDGCHNPGPGANEFLPNGNPYLLRPPSGPYGGRKIINPATYLGGGRDFGPFVPGSADIISRNLTPDRTGRPEGGHTFAEFVQIIRTGIDMDHLHPNCPAGTVNPGCVPGPFNGALLQIMPWATYQDMTDHDLRAIYEYLCAIPCVAGPPAPDPRHNDCH
jgi:hypothetical protein